MKEDHGVDGPQVSPDGRWLAYASDETGEWEVYVRPFRRGGEKVRISPEGGRQPRWRGDGKELFYVMPRGQLMALDVRASGERLEVGLPRELFNAGVSSAVVDEYGVTRDGQRFLVIRPVEGTARSVKMILNWPSLLH
jgi:hypothetical protein